MNKGKVNDYFSRYIFLCYSYSIQLCLKLRDKIADKKRRKLVYILISPYLIVRCLFLMIAEKTIGTIIANVVSKKESMISFENEISIVAVLKNEAPYIKEWIEFHKIVGVTKFYLYDNESNDNVKSILQTYIEDGEVEYIFSPGKSIQLKAYNDAIQRHKFSSKYMAFIDLDEFLCPEKFGNSISAVTEALFKKYSIHTGGIGVTWRIFGSSGLEKKPSGFVIENYLKRGADDCWQNYHIKTICNPRVVKKYVSPHFPQYRLGFWSINEEGKRLPGWYPLGQCYNHIKINHYFCKSREEAILKRNRGLADREAIYDWTKFEEYDLNDVYDDSMLDYIDNLNKIIGNTKCR